MTDEDQFLTEAADNVSWDLAHRDKIFGLENRRKSSQSINDDICSAFYLQFILLLKISIFYLVAEKKDVV